MKKFILLIFIIAVNFDIYAQESRPKTKLEAATKLVVKGGTKNKTAELVETFIGTTTAVISELNYLEKKYPLHKPSAAKKYITDLTNAINGADPELSRKIIDLEKTFYLETNQVLIGKKIVTVAPESKAFMLTVYDELLRNPKDFQKFVLELQEKTATESPTIKVVSPKTWPRVFTFAGVLLALDGFRRAVFDADYTIGEFNQDLKFIDESSRRSDEANSEIKKVTKTTTKAFGY